MQALGGERSRHPERIVDGLAGNEAPDDVAGHGRRGHRALDLASPGGPEQHVAERGGWAQRPQSWRRLRSPGLAGHRRGLCPRPVWVWVRRTSAGGRRSRNAVIPSCASSDANSRAESSTISSPCALDRLADVAIRQALGLQQSLRRCLEQVGCERMHSSVDLLRCDSDEPDSLRLGGVERLAGEEVLRRGTRSEAGEDGHRDHRRGEPDPCLGDGEGAPRPGHRDVACADEPHAAGAHVTVDSGNNGLGHIDDEAQYREETRCAVPVIGPVDASDRSAPAQNVVPVWVSTIARTSALAPRCLDMTR